MTTRKIPLGTAPNVTWAEPVVLIDENGNLGSVTIQASGDGAKETTLQGLSDKIPDGLTVIAGKLQVETISSSDATAANQVIANNYLETIDGKLPDLISGRIPVDISSMSVTVSNTQLEISNDEGNPVPISALDLPLPIGAATSSLQEVGNLLLTDVNSNLNTIHSDLTLIDTSLNSIDGKLPSGLTVIAGKLQVDANTSSDATAANQEEEINLLDEINTKLPFQITPGYLPVSGTVTANLGTLNGSATEAKQDDANTLLDSIDTKLPALVNNAIPVQISDVTSLNPLPVTGNINVVELSGTTAEVGQATLAAITVQGFKTLSSIDENGFNLADRAVITCNFPYGTQDVSATSLPLPTGAATEATLLDVKTGINALVSGPIDVDINNTVDVTGDIVVEGKAGGVPLYVAGSEVGVLLGNTDTPTTGAGYDLGRCLSNLCIQLEVVSGSLSTINAEIQVSLRDGGYQTILTSTDATDGAISFIKNSTVKWVRVNLVSITGTTPVIKYHIGAAI
ncbi:hypothetical protein H6G33_10625 [Calothrix sp. FACHB-1219]|uniref:hypothetical protein n=1 Tax=unclassified Calothrix TaxID=2619626 RepID=UPI001686943A|nr:MULTISPECIES: hypothetical protein [unclassified Calothrix]MBD2201802.1 hypothetical protein [Calothrix sp. FACHB-168]MBD2217488.1 hypothetical protein [Calothrix sp. FACHB-1219]